MVIEWFVYRMLRSGSECFFYRATLC